MPNFIHPFKHETSVPHCEICQKAKQPCTHPIRKFIQSPLSIMKLSKSDNFFIRHNLLHQAWMYSHNPKKLWHKFKNRHHFQALWHEYNSQQPRSINTFTIFEKQVNEIIDSMGFYLPMAQRKKIRDQRRQKI